MFQVSCYLYYFHSLLCDVHMTYTRLYELEFAFWKCPLRQVFVSTLPCSSQKLSEAQHMCRLPERGAAWLVFFTIAKGKAYSSSARFLLSRTAVCIEIEWKPRNLKFSKTFSFWHVINIKLMKYFTFLFLFRLCFRNLVHVLHLERTSVQTSHFSGAQWLLYWTAAALENPLPNP